ncbi:ExbD/TolR family protein [Flavobacterium sp.]|uniref:ExbD/TolR family protein n=1 Tax=Flavobacterium sp. TaxID=239 RepID=UPI003D6BACF6
MSERSNDFGRKSITPKCKKLHPRVDLTPMVNVSFLLIIFFILTSFLSRPNIMDLGMPGGSNCGGDIICGFGSGGSRVVTILIGKDNRIVTYSGNLFNPLEEPKLLTSVKNALRKELLKKSNLVVSQTGDPKKGLIVIIKPSKESNYGNLVDVLDEMAIVKVPTYAVVDITTEEELLVNK